MRKEEGEDLKLVGKGEPVLLAREIAVYLSSIGVMAAIDFEENGVGWTFEIIFTKLGSINFRYNGQEDYPQVVKDLQIAVLLEELKDGKETCDCKGSKGCHGDCRCGSH